MRILITNDDGINSPALPMLAKWAERLGEVITIAPKVEQSGKSHAIIFTRSIEVKRVDIGEGLLAYSMDSTPADCVRFAVLGRKEKYDLVISGINRGFNLGKDIVYSGTAGAIFEAGRLGIPAIALSTHPDNFDSAVENLDRVWQYITNHKLFTENSLYNINIPDSPKGIRITRQGGIYFSDEFVHLEGDMYEQTGGIVTENEGNPEFDTDSVRDGYISITPLMAERTNFYVFDKLKGLN